jgi:hypothetical protein
VLGDDLQHQVQQVIWVHLPTLCATLYAQRQTQRTAQCTTVNSLSVVTGEQSKKSVEPNQSIFHVHELHTARHCVLNKRNVRTQKIITISISMTFLAIL